MTQLVVGWIGDIYQMKLFGLLGIKSSSRYIWHILHMPARFFFQRQPGDLQQIEEDNRKVSETLILKFVPLMINSLMMLFYACAMFKYSLPLSCLGMLAVLVNQAISMYLSKRRVNIMRVIKKDSGKLMSASMCGARMFETIKSTGAETGYFQRWVSSGVLRETLRLKTSHSVIPV